MGHLSKYAWLTMMGSLSSVTMHAQSQTHAPTSTTTKGKASAASADAEIIEAVDAYLNQILCANTDFKLWKEGLYRASKSPLNESKLRQAFSENLFYSLMPGQERQEFSTAIPGIYSQAESLTKELADIAAFFSSTMHELLTEENLKRKESGKPAISQDDFVMEFGNGTLSLKNPKDGGDYKAWIDAKIEGIQKLTADLKYGCAGNRNFIYRANSKLGSVIDLDSFVIPATKKSAASLSQIAENAKTSSKHEESRKHQPQAAVLKDKDKETLERAEAIYQPQIRTRVVRSQQMMGATFYFTPSENDSRYRGAKTRRLYNESGKVIASVSAAFYQALSVQGAGILADGRTVNYVRTRGGTARYQTTTSKYGLGKNSNPLRPWRSVAVDFDHYRRRGITLKLGQQIYIPSTYGLKIPGTNRYHDGIWELADVGGDINGARIDMFTGDMHWKDALAYVNKPSNYNDNKRNAEANLLGSSRKKVTVKFLR